MKKLVLLMVVLVIGAVIYVIFFSDLFKPTTTFGEIIDDDQTDEITIQNHDTLFLRFNELFLNVRLQTRKGFKH